ncbi:MAG: beta-N-acetylglucosaminidase domain-containing protein [Acidimicrobiia bacterium]|nr:beta-N-acetylglucosaminidase domain-containing protein [Acidimicrobiia bacterium]
MVAAVTFGAVLVPVTATAGRAASAPPPFAFTGAIEGSYGPPWSHADRLSAINWMAANGLDIYIHAPKFDPYARANWRDPYPPAQRADFASEIALASRLGVAWVPDISPGLPEIPGPPASVPSTDICFSCPADVATLEAKLQPFFAAGARTLMISFDDVAKASTHPEDLARYGRGDAAYGNMNRDLLNTVARHFQAQAAAAPFRLFTVLADYSGTGDTAYLAAVRSHGGLDPDINVLWTGDQVVSPTINQSHAAAYARLVGRTRVGIWDNYPTNDYTGNAAGNPVRLFLGPVEGRSPTLATAVSGIVANVMNEAAANRFALGTLARYTARPATYDPEAAWRSTIASLGDAHLADALAALAENSRSSSLDRNESVLFVPRRDAFLAALATPSWTGAYSALSAELDREDRAAATITTGWPELAGEIQPFLAQLTAESATALTAAHLLAAQRPSLSAVDRGGTVVGTAAPPSPAAVTTLAAQLPGLQAADLADPHAVYGDRLTPALSDPKTTGTLFVNQNRIDAFVATASQITAAWLPSAPQAARAVTVTVDGHAVTVKSDGTFSLDAGPGPHSVVATDGAGRQTAVVVGTPPAAAPPANGAATHQGPAVLATQLAATGPTWPRLPELGALLLLVALALRRRLVASGAANVGR